ncbi:MAG TPA: FHA domain-containing protein, partial [Acidimicrobiia bacterium]|nr:FHA domain-containing protein [Acidimicrobiia bacterium]
METITNLGLRCGDELLVSPRRIGPATTRARCHGGLELAIVAGPDSGRRFLFGDGVVVVGRSRSADATLSDPSVSRRHCAFELTDGVIRVFEVRAPIFVEERAIGPGAGLRVGELVTLGSTVAIVREAEKGPQGSEIDGQRRPDDRGRPDEHGRVAFNRPPRGQTVSTRFEVTLGAPPDRPRRIMLSGATALAPLLMGGAMLVLTRNPLMLVFMALSPVMAVWSYVEERRRGHRAFRVEAHAFRARLEHVIEQVRSATVVERNVRRAGAPDTACLVARAESQASTLWERRASDDDFLRLRLGWARHRSLARVTVEAGGSAELRAEAEQVISDASERPLGPSVVDLRAAGSLGLAGPRPLVHRSATWLVVQLATLHSPRDVSIELAIESSSLDGWDWAKWLPHTRGLADRESCGLALGSTEAGALIERLAQVVTARVRHSRSLTASDAPEVRIVAFIDEATDVDRSTVARLLAEGPDVG